MSRYEDLHRWRLERWAGPPPRDRTPHDSLRLIDGSKFPEWEIAWTLAGSTAAPRSSCAVMLASTSVRCPEEAAVALVCSDNETGEVIAICMCGPHWTSVNRGHALGVTVARTP